MEEKLSYRYTHFYFIVLLLIITGLRIPIVKSADLSYWQGCFAPEDIFFTDKHILSEEAARRIIKEEAAKADINFDIEEFNIELPQYIGCGRIIPYYPSSIKPNNRIFSVDYELMPSMEYSVFPEYQMRISHKFDVTDRKHHIVCDYISELDTIVYYRTSKKTAQALVTELRSQVTNYWYGIFYSCSEDTLRFQVRCFIAWLRTNGHQI